MPAPTPTTALASLSQQRMLDLARVFGLRVRSTASRKDLAKVLGAQLEGQLPALLRELGRDELVTTCKAHEVPADSPARVELIAKGPRAHPSCSKTVRSFVCPGTPRNLAKIEARDTRNSRASSGARL